MEEELTTLMHMEFCLNEEERLDIAAMSIDCEVFQKREITFEAALKKYSITEKQFWEHSTLTEVLDYPKMTLEEFKKNRCYFTEKLHNILKACKTKQEICYAYEKYLKDNDKEVKEALAKENEKRRIKYPHLYQLI
jgi:tRNA U34 5-carboxymethylaminomethyl modifying enzyme MnmG/GidA